MFTSNTTQASINMHQTMEAHYGGRKPGRGRKWRHMRARRRVKPPGDIFIN
jgi:hypothetical protein